MAIVSVVIGAFAIAGGRSSARLDYFRGAVALYLTTVTEIFIVLLSGCPSADMTAVPWDNTVLHYIMPVVVILDWLVDGSGARVPFWRAGGWLAVPLAYLVYSMVRGAIVHRHPYPFMNPALHGYVGVLVTSAVIAAVLATISWIVAEAPHWAVLAPLGRWTGHRPFSLSAQPKPSDSSSG